MTPIINRLFPSGAWEVSDITDNYRLRRRYFLCTRREAVRQFKAEFHLQDKQGSVKKGYLP